MGALAEVCLPKNEKGFTRGRQKWGSSLRDAENREGLREIYVLHAEAGNDLRTPWASKRKEVEQREGLRGFFTEDPRTSSSYTGLGIATVERERVKRRLINVIYRFKSDEFSYGTEARGIWETSSAEAASALIATLPPYCSLPRIAPDGEGGVILAWEVGRNQLIMLVYDWSLYCVINPGPHAQHLPTYRFDGEAIPREVLAHIPRT